MKAVVFKGPFDVAVEDVPDPKIEQPLDAIIRITTANICGSDLHPYEGRAPLNAVIRGRATPSIIVSHKLPLADAPQAYGQFDKRADGWTKVLLRPAA